MNHSIFFSCAIIFLLVWLIPVPGQVEEMAKDQAGDPVDQRQITPEKLADFYEALDNIFPMSPAMVDKFLQTYLVNETAILNRPEPAPLIDFQMVSLDPGSKPPLVRVAPGIASAIGFFDATGAPWPIHQFVVGDGANFEIIQLGENSNSLTISPLARVGQTNLVISLKEEATPLVLKVGISSETVHYQLNFQITRLGPAPDPSRPGPDQQLPLPDNQDLLKALAGTFAPEEAMKLPIAGVKADGWVKGEDLFIRTRYQLLSPPWLGSLAGPDGIVSYYLPYSSVLLFSVGDQVKKVTLNRPEGTR